LIRGTHAVGEARPAPKQWEENRLSVAEGRAVASSRFGRFLVMPTASIQWIVVQARRSLSLAVSTDSHRRHQAATNRKSVGQNK
jgi:hypothetical protein